MNHNTTRRFLTTRLLGGSCAALKFALAIGICQCSTVAFAAIIPWGTGSSTTNWDNNTASGWNGSATVTTPNISLGLGNEGLVGTGKFIRTSATNHTFDSKLTLDSGASLRIEHASSITYTASDLVLNGATIYRTDQSNVPVLAGNISVLDGTHNYFESTNALGSSMGISANISSATSNAIIERRNGPAASFNFSGNNTGYLGNWLVTSGFLRFSGSTNALGSSSSTITASSTGAVTFDNGMSISHAIYLDGTNGVGGAFAYRSGQGNGTVTFSNLNLNGGQIAKLNDSSGELTVAGTVNVLANSGINHTTGVLTITANFVGDDNLTKRGTSTTTINANNSGYSGTWVVEEGVLSFAWAGAPMLSQYPLALGTGKIMPMGTGIARLNLNDNVWTIGNDLGGTGKVQVGTTSSSTRTLNLQGSQIDPGSGATPGILTIEQGNAAGTAHVALALNANDSSNAELVIDVTGAGATAGTDHDQLLMTRGNLTGLNNANLVVKIANTLTLGDLAGDSLTIVQMNNGGTISDFSQFAGVSFTGPLMAQTITYNASSIVLSNWAVSSVPEPSTWAMLALGTVGLFCWRKRRQN